MRIADPFAKAAEVLSAATSVALACHVNPDADALGSMLGLSTHLRAHGEGDGVLVPERAVRAAAVGLVAAGDGGAGSSPPRSPRIRR